MKISTSPFRIFPLAFLLGALVLTSCDDDDNKEDDTQNGQNDPLTLGVTTNVDTLIESNEDEAILNFQFNETPPEDGVEVALTVSVDDGSSKPLARFKIAAFDPETDIQGGSLLEQPDLSVLLDAAPEIGMARASARGDLDRFEQEQQAFFHRVRNGYLERVDRQPERWLVVDAGEPLDAVQAELSTQLNRVVAGWLS